MHTTIIRSLLLITITCFNFTYNMHLITEPDSHEDKVPLISTCRIPGLYPSDLRKHVSEKLYATLDPHSCQKSYGASQLSADLSVVKANFAISTVDGSFGFCEIDSPHSLLKKQPHLTEKQRDILAESHSSIVIVDEHHKRLIEINDLTHVENSLANQINAANHWMNENSDIVMQAPKIIMELTLQTASLIKELEDLNNTHESCKETTAEKDLLLEKLTNQLSANATKEKEQITLLSSQNNELQQKINALKTKIKNNKKKHEENLEKASKSWIETSNLNTLSRINNLVKENTTYKRLFYAASGTTLLFFLLYYFRT